MFVNLTNRSRSRDMQTMFRTMIRPQENGIHHDNGLMRDRPPPLSYQQMVPQVQV